MNIAARTASWLPYDAEVEYLQGVSGAYIDTQIIPSSQNGNTLDVFASYQGADVAGCLYGEHKIHTGYDNYYQLNKTNVAKQFRIITFNGDVLFSQSGYDLKHHYVLSGKDLYIDGEYVITGAGTEVNDANTMYLFARNNMGVADQFGEWRIYSLRYTRDGEVLIDIFPVRVGSVGYMYDRVSKTLFGNCGSGAFIIGPDVSAANGGVGIS